MLKSSAPLLVPPLPLPSSALRPMPVPRAVMRVTISLLVSSFS